MVAYIFDTILSKGVRQGQIPARTQSARDWFRTTAKSTKTTPGHVIKEADKTQYISTSNIGRMYLFQYDAKHKKTLPYFDQFPLIFPIRKAKGGFYGLNMHYLPLRQRAMLMDALYTTVNNTRYDESTKLKLNMKTLSGAAKFKWFRPTVHHYLTKQLRSRFVEIAAADWDTALFLPLARFQGASQNKVWQDTRKKVS